MTNVKKHAALIIALIMVLTVVPGIFAPDTAAAASKLSKPKLTNYAASSTSIKNTWNRVKGAKGYEIYRATKAKGEFKKVKTIKKGKTTSWTNKKLKKNKNYFYKIRAYKTVNGKKQYSKYSKVQWAIPTNEPNWEYSMSSKKKTTGTVSVKITNKGKSTMKVYEGGIFLSNKTAFNECMKRLEAGTLYTTDGNTLQSKGIYSAEMAKTVNIKPGKSGTLKYSVSSLATGEQVKVSYSAKSYINSNFKFGKKDYGMFNSDKYDGELVEYAD